MLLLEIINWKEWLFEASLVAAIGAGFSMMVVGAYLLMKKDKDS